MSTESPNSSFRNILSEQMEKLRPREGRRFPRVRKWWQGNAKKTGSSTSRLKPEAAATSENEMRSCSRQEAFTPGQNLQGAHSPTRLVLTMTLGQRTGRTAACLPAYRKGFQLFLAKLFFEAGTAQLGALPQPIHNLFFPKLSFKLTFLGKPSLSEPPAPTNSIH